MTILWSIAGFVLAMGILVSIHEWGHYVVARMFNIKVTEFSVGFGRAIFSFQRGETRFKVAMIPLGGFVKFLDERDESLSSTKNEDFSRAFNRQSVFVRFAVVIAGPLVNLIFAWLVFSFIYLSGVSGFKPVFESAKVESTLSKEWQGSNASQILSVDNHRVNTWKEVDQRILLALVDKQDNISVRIKPVELKASPSTLILSLSELDINDLKQGRIKPLGFIPKLPVIPAVLGEIKLDSPAYKAGFEKGDKILTVNQQPIESWHAFVSIVRASANKNLSISFERENVVFSRTVVPFSSEQQAGIGYFGSAVLLDKTIYEPYRATTNYSFIDAFKQGYQHSVDLIDLSLTMIKRMLFGEVDASNLSGPISIADYSGQALQIGWGAFFNLLALLSLSLGILNLLPIPVLDGGNLMLYIIEIIKGSPLNMRIELVLQQIGMLLIFSLTFFAIFNDVVRISNG